MINLTVENQAFCAILKIRRENLMGEIGMDFVYKNWLEEEIKWHKRNNRSVKKRVFRIAVGIAVFIELLFGALGILGNEISLLPYYLSAGAVFVLLSCVPYLTVTLCALRPKRQIKLLCRAADELDLSPEDRKQFANEMEMGLRVPQKTQNIEYHLPNFSAGRMARFVLTEHYAFQEGGNLFPVAVSLQEVSSISCYEISQQERGLGTEKRKKVPSAVFAVAFQMKRGRQNEIYERRMFFPDETVLNSVLCLLKGREDIGNLLRESELSEIQES